MSWSRPFDDPIPTPKGKPRNAERSCGMALPKKEADDAQWQACILVEEASRSCKAKPLLRWGA
jgi:hypothetical protein